MAHGPTACTQWLILFLKTDKTMISSATPQCQVWRLFLPTPGPGRFLLSAGAILLLGGAAKLLTVLEHPQVLDITDPVFSLSFRGILALIGLAEIAVAWLCLFTNKRGLSLTLVAWLTFNIAVYRIALWMMSWHHPWPLLGSLTEGLGISPLIADSLIAAASAYLFIGSSVLLLETDGRLARFIAARLGRDPNVVKMSCSSCGGHIQFGIKSLGSQTTCPHCKAEVTLRRPEEMIKIFCYFCKGHIEFPPHAIGEKLKCPHCHNDITLKEPATASH